MKDPSTGMVMSVQKGHVGEGLPICDLRKRDRGGAL